MLRTALLLPLLFVACATPPRRGDFAVDPALLASVRAVIAELGPGVRAAIWLSEPRREPQLQLGVDDEMPVASAIKVGYLVELFAERPDRLDQSLPDVAAVFADPKHPAIAGFSAAQRTTAQQALATASVRRLGEAMITGKGVDNITYNIAANLVTAHFGGPVWLDQKLHARDPAWQGLHVRRYMLADRAANGDNTATARALAAVHGRLALGAVPGVDARAVKAARDVLAKGDDAVGCHVFNKSGALDSDPVTRVEAGWHETPQHTFVHVVMLAQYDVSPASRASAGQRLGAAAKRIEQLLLATP